MMTRAQQVLVLGLLSGIVLAGAAQAAGPVVSVEPESGTPGQPVTVRGSGFCGAAECGTVRITVYGAPAAQGVRVSPRGTFVARARIPGGAPMGEVGLIATQRLADGSELQAFSTFELLLRARASRPAQPAENPKPRTHAEASPREAGAKASERRDGGGVEGTGRRGSDPQEKAGGAQAASGSRSRRSDEELPVLWALAAVVALGGVFAFGVRARRRTRANAVQ